MLQGYSFMSYTADPATFEMHRLVQLAIQKWLKSHRRLERCGLQFISNLDDAFPSGEFKEWAVCQLLFPHIMAALEMKLLSIGAQLRQANLLLKSGWYASQQGAFDTAEKMQSLAMKVHRKMCREEHPSTLRSMANLARTYADQGKLDAALELEEQVLLVRKRVLGEEHPDTLTSTANLASTYWNQGRWDKAEKLEVEVLETRKRVLLEGHPDTLVSMVNLAITLRDLGRQQSAVDLMNQYMALSSDKLGPKHPDTLDRCQWAELWAAKDELVA